MTAVEASTVPSTESGLVVKMEDRKRPASYDPNESTPPLKKQATSLNGGGKPHPDTDMPWRDDLEVSSPMQILVLNINMTKPVVSQCALCDRARWDMMILTILAATALSERCHLASNAGVQT